MKNNKIFSTMVAVMLALLISSCGGSNSNESGDELVGSVRINGSSTVYPVSEAVAEEFMGVHGGVKVTVGESGTGAGFKKFSRSEIDISDASRSIKDKEIEACKEAGIEYIKFDIAYDGMSVLVHPKNDWMSEVTVEQLKKIWEPDAQNSIKNWNQIDPSFPDKALHLFGPGTASGTFDYFTKKIVGESGNSRGDYTASEDDNVLVQGISSDEGALGYFGLAYYEANKDKLKLLGVDNGDGAVKPTLQSVKDGTYKPLSRPLFIYVSKKSLERKEVKAFVKFYLENASQLVSEIGYIPLPDAEYQKQLELLK